MIKSERLRTTTITGTPSVIAVMPGQGVEWARLGANDPYLPLGITYDMPLPYANIVFNSSPGPTANEGVMAFPFSAKIIVTQPTLILSVPRFRKPIFTTGS